MKVKLVTLCGCSREFELPNFTPDIKVPIHGEHIPSLHTPPDLWYQVQVPTRLFKYARLEGDVAIYREA